MRACNFPVLVHLDAGDLQPAAEWITAQAADVVFYPAGFTWVDGCERDRSRAYAANLEQPLNLARAAARVGSSIRLLLDRLRIRRPGRTLHRRLCHQPALSVRTGQARRGARAREPSWATSSSRFALPGFLGPSGKARTLHTNCSGTWPTRSRRSVPPIRFPIRVMGRTWPAPRFSWPKQKPAG